MTSAVSRGLCGFVKNGVLEPARVYYWLSEAGIIVLLYSLPEHYGL